MRQHARETLALRFQVRFGSPLLVDGAGGAGALMDSVGGEGSLLTHGLPSYLKGSEPAALGALDGVNDLGRILVTPDDTLLSGSPQ
ncbi:hypothetical protein JXA47_14035 [Candidatus Sumerlaeota bacterium]|nr:hypothetical protein [Candidatus Sumerlaeota bacterium]